MRQRPVFARGWTVAFVLAVLFPVRLNLSAADGRVQVAVQLFSLLAMALLAYQAPRNREAVKEVAVAGVGYMVVMALLAGVTSFADPASPHIIYRPESWPTTVGLLAGLVLRARRGGAPVSEARSQKPDTMEREP